MHKRVVFFIVLTFALLAVFFGGLAQWTGQAISFFDTSGNHFFIPLTHDEETHDEETHDEETHDEEGGSTCHPIEIVCGSLTPGQASTVNGLLDQYATTDDTGSNYDPSQRCGYSMSACSELSEEECESAGCSLEYVYKTSCDDGGSEVDVNYCSQFSDSGSCSANSWMCTPTFESCSFLSMSECSAHNTECTWSSANNPECEECGDCRGGEYFTECSIGISYETCSAGCGGGDSGSYASGAEGTFTICVSDPGPFSSFSDSGSNSSTPAPAPAAPASPQSPSSNLTYLASLQPDTSSLIAWYLNDSSNRAGRWGEFGPNTHRSFDHHFVVHLALDRPKRLQDIVIVHDTPGEYWSTYNPGAYPVVVYFEGTQRNTAYGPLELTLQPGSYTFHLYAQAESSYRGAQVRFALVDPLNPSLVTNYNVRAQTEQAARRALQQETQYELNLLQQYVNISSFYIAPVVFTEGDIDSFISYLFSKYLVRTATSEEFLFWRGLTLQRTASALNLSTQSALAQVEASFWRAAQREISFRYGVNASSAYSIAQTLALLNASSVSSLSLGSLACFDSDGGTNTFLLGRVTTTELSGELRSYSDSCLDGQRLQEQICSQGRLSSSVVTCSEGCSSGSCIRLVERTAIAPVIIETSGGTSRIGSTSISTSLVCDSFTLRSPFTGSASDTSPQVDVAFAYDGDVNTVWYGAHDDTFPKTLTFDMGEKLCLRDTDIYFPHDDLPVTFSVSLSEDGSHWSTPVAHYTTSHQRVVALPFPSVFVGRYVRVTLEGSVRPYGALSDIKLFASPLREVRA